MREQILGQLSPAYPWRDRLHVYPQLDSTNSLLKELARQGAPHGTAILADSQTGGRGRLGRQFSSPAGMGVYLSILLRPDCAPEALMHLTCAVAVAMCDAVEHSAGFRPGIKWTNDLVSGRRKLGGILTELGLSPQGRVDWAVVGIGINCRQQRSDFPPELRDMAGSLSMAAGHPVDRCAAAASMLDSLAVMDRVLLDGRAELLDAYRLDCITLGREISLVLGSEIRRGTALDVDEQGALIVRFADGSIQAVNSGEVSVRGLYGYV